MTSFIFWFLLSYLLVAFVLAQHGTLLYQLSRSFHPFLTLTVPVLPGVRYEGGEIHCGAHLYLKLRALMLSPSASPPRSCLGQSKARWGQQLLCLGLRKGVGRVFKHDWRNASEAPWCHSYRDGCWREKSVLFVNLVVLN